MTRALAWGLLGLTAGASVAAVALSTDDRIGPVAVAVWLIVTAVTGAVLASRLPRNPIGWLLLAMTVGVSIWSLTDAYARHFFAPGSGVDVLIAAWLAHWLAVPSFAMLLYVVLLFPDGRLPGRRWRILAVVAGAAVAAGTVMLALHDGPLNATGQHNPVGIGPTVSDERGTGGMILGALVLVVDGSGAAAVLSLIFRYRRAGGEVRQQLRWLAFSGVVLALSLLFAAVSPAVTNELSFFIAVFGLTSFPVAIAVAVLRYRLYDLGLVVNRALVYLLLTVIVSAVYVAGVVTVGTLFDRALGLAASLAATALVAALFQPLRQGVQHLVDRMLFGERRDPYSVLAGLGRRLQSAPDPTTVPDLVVQTLTGTVGVSYAAVEFDHGGSTFIAAAAGARPDDVDAVELRYQGETMGRLLFATDGAVNRRRAVRLVSDVARQASPALHAVRLTAALQRSRERLVVAREEERRRLRADLHDTLGPQLAGLAMGLEAAENLLRDRPAEAAAVLARLRTRSQEAVGTVRGVIDGLRPSALDDLGLVEAIRQRAEDLAPSGHPAITVTTGALPPLPAAVEVAVYAIAVEALTNAVRHAGARSVSVVLECRDGGLAARISDDGRGMPTEVGRDGVGLGSMRERAAELGGTVSISRSDPQGVMVIAMLPIDPL